jgi:hypothetical protein
MPKEGIEHYKNAAAMPGSLTGALNYYRCVLYRIHHALSFTIRCEAINCDFGFCGSLLLCTKSELQIHVECVHECVYAPLEQREMQCVSRSSRCCRS